MSARKAQRDLPAGRLAGFEGSDDDDDLSSLLAPRRRRARSTPPPSPPGASETPTGRVPTPTGTDSPSDGGAPADGDVKATTTPTSTGRADDAHTSHAADPDAEVVGVEPDATTRPASSPDSTETATQGGSPRRSMSSLGARQTVVSIPVSLREQVVRERDREGSSNGFVLIKAIETVYGDLQGAFTAGPEPTPGGLFGSRSARPVRQASGETLCALNVRLRAADFEILDQLVVDVGATSRSDLVTTALRLYFAT